MEATKQQTNNVQINHDEQMTDDDPLTGMSTINGHLDAVSVVRDCLGVGWYIVHTQRPQSQLTVEYGSLRLNINRRLSSAIGCWSHVTPRGWTYENALIM